MHRNYFTVSKSLKRVAAALEHYAASVEIMEMPTETRTAELAAEAVGCEVDQIAKSIVFEGHASGQVFVFVTAGGKQVDRALASELAGEPLIRADAAAVRQQTGFAIGGVSPVGHISPIPVFLDRNLTNFDIVYAAAGTPNHVFSISPTNLIDAVNVQPSDFTS